MVKERQNKAKLLTQHFKHIKVYTAYIKYERQKKKKNTVDLCSIAPVLTSIEAIQPLTTEEPLCHWRESLRISNCKIYLASWKGYVEFHVASESGGNRKTPGSIFRKDVLRFVLRAYTKQNRNRWVASSVPSAMRILSLFLFLSLSLSHTHTIYKVLSAWSYFVKSW